MSRSYLLCVIFAFFFISSFCYARDCYSDPCQNGGTCYFHYNAVTGSQYVCGCLEPYYGKDCEKIRSSTSTQPISKTTTEDSTTMSPNSTAAADSCFNNPCKNGGLCRIDGLTYKCFCPSPFTGRTCNSRVCYGDPCLNGGVCYFHYNAVTGNQYACDCVEPYYGKNCDKIKSSTSSQLTLDTTVEGRTTITPNLSTIEDPCTNNPCKNGGLCRVQGLTYKCFCPSPYSGRTCNSGSCFDHPCLNKGECYIHYDAVTGDQFACNCTEPYYGWNCGKMRSSTSTELTSKTETTPFSLTKAESSLATEVFSSMMTTAVSKVGDCYGNPCLNGGECYFHYDEVTGDQYACDCVEPYYGKNCEQMRSLSSTETSLESEITPLILTSTESKFTNITYSESTTFVGNITRLEDSTTGYPMSTIEPDPCFDNPCQNGGLCRVQGLSYRCFCPSPFFGQTCTSDPCSNSPCENGGMCVVNGDSHTCYCQHPFRGKNCEIGPCSDNPCKNEGTCRTVGSSFKCSCKAPYFGLRCEKDGCHNQQCKNGGICKSNARGFGYKCYCSSPFTGAHCENGPCSNSPCKNDGICKVERDAHMCFCRSPYSGKSCEIDPCSENPCLNGGRCEVRRDSYKCYCKKPYTGALCEKEEEPMTTETTEGTTVVTTSKPVKCKCKNGKCITTQKGTICECNPGFAKGDDGTCIACNCGEQYNCTFEKSWFKLTKTCICPEGYKDIEGKCVDTCNCENGKCATTANGKECVCNPGFGMHPDGYCQACDCGENHSCTFEKLWLITRKTCICPKDYEEIKGKCVDPCSFKPCKNGGKCRLTKDSYKCDCSKEFTGKFCQTERCKCKNGKCIEVGKELKCVCNPDYGLYSDGVCEACNCGEGFTCTFDRGTFGDKIYCVCPEGYSMVDKKCIKKKT